MSYDWHNHPLHSNISNDGKIHVIYQVLNLGLTPLGRLQWNGDDLRFLPHDKTSYTDTQLWQIMAYMSDMKRNAGVDA